MASLAHAGMVVLEGIFFLGLLGSALVIVLTSLEDVKVLFEKDSASRQAQ
jgi:hypothetical protein